MKDKSIRSDRNVPEARRSTFRISELRKSVRPFRLHWFPRLRSTNDHAAALRGRDELFAPAIVLAGCQTAGRGRGANQWWSSSGTLTVTFVMPIDEQLAPHQLPLLAGLAIRNAVADMLPGAPVKLKWPNDILVEGRKLAGLLCERVHKADLIGLGININVDPTTGPLHLRDRITSFSELVGGKYDMSTALNSLAKSLYAMLTLRDGVLFNERLRQYDEHHALSGRHVTISATGTELPISGKCEGLDSMGRLLVRDGRTLRHIIAGQVSLLSP